jgi:FMN hydrolase / 5-amino-6-(5-phospho-D-ribitylamino)uracil phosphatase
MRRPDVVLFDVMGTLVHDPFGVEIPAFFEITLRELIRIKHPSTWLRFEHGEIDGEEALSQFFADGHTFDHEAFIRMVRGAYRFLDGIEPLLIELSARGVEMHALSNYPRWYLFIEEALSLSRWVKWTFVSCETGVRKPDPTAYTRASEKLGLAPERCLFVDDRAVNCDAAHAVGMDAILFTEAGALRRELEARGLL